MKWRRFRRWFAVLCAATTVVFCLVVWYVGDSLTAPTNHAVGPPPADLPAVATTIPSDSGSTLAAWYIPAVNSHATVILLHPIRADRRSMLGRARFLHQAGYAV